MPVVTQVNFEEGNEVENAIGISSHQAGILMSKPVVVKPGHRKFNRDADTDVAEAGYSQPTESRRSEHLPTPIPSLITFRGDVVMNSREDKQYDNSATLPMMDNASAYSSASSGEAQRLNSIVINIKPGSD